MHHPRFQQHTGLSTAYSWKLAWNMLLDREKMSRRVLQVSKGAQPVVCRNPRLNKNGREEKGLHWGLEDASDGRVIQSFARMNALTEDEIRLHRTHFSLLKVVWASRVSPEWWRQHHVTGGTCTIRVAELLGAAIPDMNS